MRTLAARLRRAINTRRAMRETVSSSVFFSYRPLFGCPMSRSARFIRTLRLVTIEAPKFRARSVLNFLSLSRRNIPPPQRQYACVTVIRSIHSPVMNARPYRESGTSCVLWPPRILADARCPQHAWQGFPPVHPTKEEACPLCWILPQCVAEAAP